MKRIALAAGIVLVAGAALAAEIGDLATTDSSNTARFPENMAPGAVNDGARALEGMIARWRTDEDCSLVSTGSSSALSVSATRTLTAYYDGLKVCFESHTDNSGATTLNVDSIGPVAIRDQNGVALDAGELQNGQKVEVVYDGSVFRVLSPLVQSTPDDLLTTQGDLIRGGTAGAAQRLALGNPDQVLTSTGGQAAWANLPAASTSVSGMQENATQTEMEASTTATGTVTPDVLVHSPFVAKGFVRFTVSGAAIATTVGQNVTVVAYDSSGDYTVQWGTDFSAATYACTALPELAGSAVVARVTAVTAGGISIKTVAPGTGSDLEVEALSVVCFGDR